MFHLKRVACIHCERARWREYRNTLSGYLKCMFNNAKRHAALRGSRGRSTASIFSIKFTDVLSLHYKQQGLCFYSGVPLSYKPLSDWQCSLERLDPAKGYEIDNIALIASEFQSRVQWSKTKLDVLASVVSIQHAPRLVNWETQKKTPRKRVYVQKYQKDDGTYYTCTRCDAVKSVEEFGKHVHSGCKQCRATHDRAKIETPRGFMIQTLTSMRNSSKHRKHHPPEFERIEDLQQLFDSQGGLCAYSGLPMNIGSTLQHDWVASPERVDTTKGYTKDNVCFICYEFNTPVHQSSVRDAASVTGSPAWSKHKFDEFKNKILEKMRRLSVSSQNIQGYHYSVRIESH